MAKRNTYSFKKHEKDLKRKKKAKEKLDRRQAEKNQTNNVDKQDSSTIE